MHYEAELAFLQNLLRNFHLNVTFIDYDYDDTDDIPDFDLGLRRSLYPPDYFSKSLAQNHNHYIINPNTIYRVSDEHMCRYVLLRLPEMSDKNILLIGPYTTQLITKQMIFDCADRLSIPPEMFPQLEKYYGDLTLLPDEAILFTIVNTFGEKLWGGLDNFTVEDIDHALSAKMEPLVSDDTSCEPEEPYLSMKVLEDRYAAENRLIQAVSQGAYQKAEMMLGASPSFGIEQRLADPIRNLKNYCIILNTLLRKAAETGSVHPVHIDTLSSRFARKIELITTAAEFRSLQREMVHKYCILVQNHSLKGYSLLIRKVLTRVDSDLTADLSLKKQAELLNVNASYLSTLFKKETGSTLTEYVNKKRMEHAIFLLNSTNMQVQTVAQYCGIPDVNYFTKTFKKHVGKTPKEYREEIAVFAS